MTVDDAIKALSPQALKMIKSNYVIGLGSGRAATAIVRLLSSYLKKNKFCFLIGHSGTFVVMLGSLG